MEQDIPNRQGPEMERMLGRLCADPACKLLNFAITRGDGPATPEDIARQVNSALDQEAAGTATVSRTFPDSAQMVDVRDFLVSLG